MGYYGITFGMANLSDDLFTNFIVSSVIGTRTICFSALQPQDSSIYRYPCQSVQKPLNKLASLKDVLARNYD